MTTTKQTMLNQIQKRLPDNIKIIDDTNFEFTESEFLSLLCWLKYFREHYNSECGKKEFPKITFPVISQRLILDFGLCFQEHAVYLYEPNRRKQKDFIFTWRL